MKETTFDRPHGPDNPRNSEGSFLLTKDGRIRFIYTRYTGKSWGDHASADLAEVFSDDGGDTWQDRGVVVSRGDAKNIMSVSLLRLADGRILMLYLRKRHAADGSVYCMPFCRWSSDEAQSWSEPVSCLQNDGYHVVNNDRLVQLSSGRIAFSMSYHWNGRGNHNPAFAIYCYSDDGGATWQQNPNPVFPSMESGTVVGWQEPGIVELAPHELMM